MTSTTSSGSSHSPSDPGPGLTGRTLNLVLVGGGVSIYTVPCACCGALTTNYEIRAEQDGTQHRLFYCSHHDGWTVNDAWQRVLLDRIAPLITSGTREVVWRRLPPPNAINPLRVGAWEDRFDGRLVCGVCLHANATGWQYLPPRRFEKDAFTTVTRPVYYQQCWQLRELRDGSARFLAYCTAHAQLEVAKTWLAMLQAGGPAHDPLYRGPDAPYGLRGVGKRP